MMKRKPNQKRRAVENSPRHSRSDHGNNSKSNILYTPPIGNVGRNLATSGGGDSALLQRLEKITNEINTMQSYPNQNQPPNQNGASTQMNSLQFNAQQHQQPQFSVPPGYPPSFSNASPRNMEYITESPRQLNEVMSSSYQHQQQPPHMLSPQRQSQQNVADTQMSLNVRSLQTSLAEAHEEHRRAMNRVELESNERRTLEQQNFELNNKLIEARQVVKDTQAALQSAQFATDQLTNKRSQREDYIKELSEVNTTNISRIATLEAKLKDAEDGLLEGNSRRDQFIHQLQSQLTASQEAMYASQAELNTLNGLKCQAETELVNLRTRHLATEQKLRDSENAIELTYKAKLSLLEEKNQSLMDKIAGEKHVYNQIQHLEEQIGHKNTALQRALESSKNAEMSLHESLGQIRHLEDVLLTKDTDIQQLETKLVKFEADMKKEKQFATQCKVLEAEVMGKNTEVKLVNQSLHDTRISLTEADGRIDSLTRELAEKNKDLMDVEHKLKQSVKMNMSERGFNEIISSMQSEISDMENTLINERSLKKAAENDVETLQIKTRSLEVNLREKMAIIAEKEADVKNLQKLVNFDQVKSSHVEELEEKLHEATHSLNLEIQSNRMNKRDLEKKDLKIASLESALQAKDASIVDLEDVIKNHSVNEMSERIMNQTIQNLEAQLVERDANIATRNEKITAVEASLQEALGRIRDLESTGRDQDSELQSMLFKKQNAEREVLKYKTTCQTLEGKIKLFETQNETIEARSKVLIFEKHEATNKLEMLEKVVQDMAESTIDSATSIKEQHRLTEELRHANEQMATLAADLEKSTITIGILRKNLEDSDEQISKLSSESHASFVANKAIKNMTTSVRESKENKRKKEEDETKSTGLSSVAEFEELKQVPSTRTLERSRTSTPPPTKGSPIAAAVLQKTPSSRKMITPAQSFMDEPGLNSKPVLTPAQSFMDSMGLSDVSRNDEPVTGPISQSTIEETLSHLEQANGIMGKRHEATSELAKMTDYINSTTRDIEKIAEKKKQMRIGIEAYTTDFRMKNKRPPTAEEKANAPDNIFTNYQQLSHILKKKNAKLAEAEEKFKKMQAESQGKSS